MRLRFWRRRSERDFRDEIEAHLALEADELMGRRDLSADEARSAARRAFGNVTTVQERFYESLRWAWLDRTVRHARYAGRMLRNHPAFSLAVIATLGIGISVNTAIFTLLYSAALRPLPVRESNRVVNVYQRLRGVSREVRGTTSWMGYGEFLAYSRGSRALQSSAVYAQTELALAAAPNGVVRGEYVSCNYFQTLRARTVLGRPFTADECAQLGEPAVAVISYGLWQRQFGGDSAIVGRPIELNRLPVTVVGVAEQGFAGVEFQSVDTWVPVTLQPALTHGRDKIVTRDASWMVMVARLAPGATIEQARAELAVVGRQQDARFPGRKTTVIVERGAYLNFPEVRSEGGFVGALIGVLGALIVIIACANVMSLLLARGVSRRREVGIRLAIGATRRWLIEQLLVESLLLALLGAALGLAVAFMLPIAMRRLSPVEGLQVDLTPDGRVFLFTLATSVITALVFGLAPALQATSVDLASAFKGSAMFGARRVRPSRLRAAVVGVQVAGSSVLLVVAALFIRAAREAAAIDPGFATHGDVALQLNLAQLGYDDARVKTTFDAVTTRIAAMPGVEGVGLVGQMPLLGRTTENILLPNAAADTWTTKVTSGVAFASAGYLSAMNIRILRGQVFDDRLANEGDRGAVVSASLAAMLWPDSEAIGRRFRAAGHDFRVTGIAANARMISLSNESTPFAYLATPTTVANAQIVVHTSGSTIAIERAVPQLVEAIDPQIGVRVERFEDRLAKVLGPARIAGAVAAASGALALLLALVGIYGVVSYTVGQRASEIAVRLALGATPRGVVSLVVRQGARPVVAGIAVGIALAVLVSTALRGLLFGISPVDPLAYTAMAALLVGASLLAMYAPARRASRVDPAAVLRQD